MLALRGAPNAPKKEHQRPHDNERAECRNGPSRGWVPTSRESLGGRLIEYEQEQIHTSCVVTRWGASGQSTCFAAPARRRWTSKRGAMIRWSSWQRRDIRSGRAARPGASGAGKVEGLHGVLAVLFLVAACSRTSLDI